MQCRHCWVLIPVLCSTGQALQELSKDKPALKHAESHTSSFIKTLQEVESALMQQITYLMQVTTGKHSTGSQ